MMKTIAAFAFLIFLVTAGAYAQESAAIQHLKAVAETGDYDAAHQLATAYAVGDGVVRNEKMADLWYSIAASRRANKATAQPVDSEEPTATGHSRPMFMGTGTAARSSSSAILPTDGLLSQSALEAQVRSNHGVSDPEPAPQQTSSNVPVWKKVANAVTAVPAKTKEFLSDHEEEVTELATFVLEKWFPGLTPSEEPASSSNAGGSTHPSK